MYMDFRKINELQPKMQRVDIQTNIQGHLSLIPLPKIDEMYVNLCGAKIFTTLDLQSGYYHIALDKESKAKTSFITPFEIILKKLKEAGLKLKESKCNFFKKEIHYLGLLISVDGIQSLPEKLDSICNMPKPRSLKEIKQFLGLTSYYRKFIPQFYDMARPLTKLLAHDCEFVWNNQCDILFQLLKDTLCSAPILKHPDTTKLYTLYTDASKYRWAGVLTQRHTSIVNGKEITILADTLSRLIDTDPDLKQQLEQGR